ncbi:hypothetical protein [Bifidobacterium catulorum]|uniref:Uncharacterized protein n=1 Tax=Bifidobacterium catulorum TaxID=1630173 RepID=A0A2U2MQG0_9BIFI|nr:hypothetical protein [Bifidobacterium catulorum]PWG59080.1 hypothetical protein DF200_09450 [Bifidobacterium catulorum]
MRKSAQTLRAIADWLRDTGNHVVWFRQRVKRGYSDHDLLDLGCNEVLRLANMLEDFSLASEGYAPAYGDRRKWLKHRHDTDEQLERWMDSGALTPGATFVSDDGREFVAESDVGKTGDAIAETTATADDGVRRRAEQAAAHDGPHRLFDALRHPLRCLSCLSRRSGRNDDGGGFRMATVREVGVDRCAWFEDLAYASAVLRMWCEWHGGAADRLDHYADVYGIDEALRRQAEIDRKFEEAWAWIGRNAVHLWD